MNELVDHRTTIDYRLINVFFEWPGVLDSPIVQTILSGINCIGSHPVVGLLSRWRWRRRRWWWRRGRRRRLLLLIWSANFNCSKVLLIYHSFSFKARNLSPFTFAVIAIRTLPWLQSVIVICDRICPNPVVGLLCRGRRRRRRRWRRFLFSVSIYVPRDILKILLFIIFDMIHDNFCSANIL